MKYQPLPSNCVQVPPFLRGFTSCVEPRTEVIAHPSSNKVLGFILAVTYREAGVQKSITVWTVPASQLADGDFEVVFLLDASSVIAVSALELVGGEIAYAP